MVVIESIEPDSVGAAAGFQIGDRIERVNGAAVKDLIDFQVLSADAELVYEVVRDGESYEVELAREPGQSLGLVFEDLKLRKCNNKCVFCFIHQMPRGLRRTLYFEDDDYRLSFLHGSYVTLTNVHDSDLDRIIEQGLSPQFISVHATDPMLRQRMLGRRKPTVDIMERLRRLSDHGIDMHAQVVLCPGWNDGEHLERTVRDLSGFHPRLKSIALVPVGLTRFRQNLPELSAVTPEIAARYLEFAEIAGQRFNQDLGERLVYGADELFLVTTGSVPQRSYYDAFPQLENGIGMVRSFLDTWEQQQPGLSEADPARGRLGLVTGELAASFMAPLVEQINRERRADMAPIVVPNEFFGRGITVSGLLTGADILSTLAARRDLSGALLPPNCINGDGLTLDDMTVEDMSERSGLPLRVGTYDLAASLTAWQRGGQGATTGAGRQLDELGYYVGKRP
jgi:putative radical SAM enzyme (TIGR03279 family)